VKPRKPIDGTVTSKLDKFGTIQRQIARGHANAMAGFAAKRSAAARIADTVKRAVVLADLPHREREECDRHRAKLSELQRRARDTW
jgi:hypothetical protein